MSADMRSQNAASRASMCPFIALRCPTYRENSHANHTWHQHTQETACFIVLADLPRGFDSHRPLHLQASDPKPSVVNVSYAAAARENFLTVSSRGKLELVKVLVNATPLDQLFVP